MSWLEDGRARFTGGLLLEGGPEGAGADLLLHPAGITVTSATSSATLSWDDCHPNVASDPTPTEWLLTCWNTGRGGGIGVALSGPALLQPILDVLAGRLRIRLTGIGRARSAPVGSPACTVPLWTSSTTDARVDRERSTVRALCLVIRSHPELRPRLADERRVSRLAHDIGTSSDRSHPDLSAGGVRRRTIEIHTAMNALGLTHRVGGRPISDMSQRDAAPLVEKVRAHLEASPYTDRVPDDRHIHDVLTKSYLSVRPWPFSALVDE